MGMTLFADVDVAAVVAASEERSNRKKPAGPRRGLDEIRGFIQKVPEGKAIFSKEIADALWNHPSRASVWPKVKTVNGLSKVIGDLLGKGGLGLARNKQRAFIIPKPSTLNNDATMALHTVSSN